VYIVLRQEHDDVRLRTMPKLPLFVMANLHLVATGFRPAYLPLERENRARYPKIIEAAAALGLKTHVFEGLDQLAAGEFRGGSGLLVYNAAAADPKLIERVIGLSLDGRAARIPGAPKRWVYEHGHFVPLSIPGE
jgi:hypothetical protein